MYESIGKNFYDKLFEYSAYHYVLITPDAVILARLYDTHWHIEVAVGEGFIRSMFDLMPVYRPFVGWARELRGKPYKYYKTESLRRLL